MGDFAIRGRSFCQLARVGGACSCNALRGGLHICLRSFSGHGYSITQFLYFNHYQSLHNLVVHIVMKGTQQIIPEWKLKLNPRLHGRPLASLTWRTLLWCALTLVACILAFFLLLQWSVPLLLVWAIAFQLLSHRHRKYYIVEDEEEIEKKKNGSKKSNDLLFLVLLL